jgi:hypothetical protein
VPDEQRGDSTASSRPAATAYSPGSRLDGRLDLDDLEATLDLDVIGADPDRPLLSEHVRRILESSGIAPFVRRHRAPVVAGSLVVALLLGSAGWWWASRPVPLPDAPLVLVKTSGPDQEQVTVDAGDGSVVGLTLTVAVASVERVGVELDLLTLTGPGLSPSPSGRISRVDTSVTDAVSTVSAGLDCTSSASAAAAIAAEPGDFGVVVRRVAPEGETRDDRIRLVGAQRLAQLVRSICLQEVADRELEATSVRITPVPGVAAADLEITLTNAAVRVWPGVRVSTGALPWLVTMRPPTDVAPGGSATLRARLWLQDCANPAVALSGGLRLRSTFSAEDSEPNAADNVGNTFSVPVDTTQLARVSSAFAGLCTSPAPSATVTQAIVHSGGSDTTAGTLELTLVVHAQDADLIEVDQGLRATGGTLTPLESPIHLTGGTGVLTAAWELPRCVDLLGSGLPRFSVNLVRLDATADRRPYSMAIRGEALDDALRRVCGTTVDGLGP